MGQETLSLAMNAATRRAITAQATGRCSSGMKERFRLPGDAILCAVEPMHPEAGRWTMHLTVVKVRCPAGLVSISGGQHGEEWEIPFLPRPTVFRKFNRAYRLAMAERLRDQIRALMPDMP
jgi:hypothetical protein